MQWNIREKTVDIKRTHMKLVSIGHGLDELGKRRRIFDSILIGGQWGQNRNQKFTNFVTGEFISSKYGSALEFFGKVSFMNLGESIDDAGSGARSIQVRVGIRINDI